ncbi:class I adenylate-forming enzyme family protein [Melittangium boletus]|uniref:class I adenylate-forming enzyme family protein n=1 Tax=Melittangium boletus TaxID=83453 RepID=UPI003DA607B9
MIDHLPAGARVVVRLPNGPGLAQALLGCFDRELVAVPMHPRSTDAAVRGIVDRVAACAVLDEHGPHDTGHPAAHPEAEGLAFLMFTSGSTGPQKGVMLSRKAVLGNAAKTAALHGLTPDRPHGTCLPLYHCNALVMSLLGTHLTGTPLVLHNGTDPAGYFAALRAAGARTASIVPALLADLLDVAPEWPEGLEYLITAAAPLTPELARRFHARYGPRLRQGYGLTEAVNFSFTTPLLDGPAFTRQYLDQHPPVGVALPETELRLVDGEVWVRTPDMMRGYWRDPAATAAALTEDGWLRTGDLGELREGLLVLRGRAGERINRGGEKHYPLEVERIWREAGLDGRFVAVAVAEPTLGQEIGLVATDQSVEAVRAVCERSPLRPAAVQWGGFQATSTGKPQRKAMGRSLVALRYAPARYERLLRYASAIAHDLLRSGVDDAGLRALAKHVTEPAREGEEPVFEALEFMRTHWHRRADPELAEAKARWRERLSTEWPLAGYTELAERLREAHPGAKVSSHLPAITTADGCPWALGPLLSFMESPNHEPESRWHGLARLREAGFAVVGCALLRAGRHDLGGVLWAHTPTSENRGNA